MLEAWQWKQKTLAPGDRIGAWLERGGRVATVAEVLQAWRSEEPLRTLWSASLAALPYAACSWETPPLTRHALDQPFECVFVDHPQLARTQPDPAPFEQPFARDPGDGLAACTFANLGGDAWLVAPRPWAGVPPAAYTHLASFVREAPAAQVADAWQRLGQAVQAHATDAPRWLSTAGMGVYWLHFRIDMRPKYYRHEPYRSADHWISLHEL